MTGILWSFDKKMILEAVTVNGDLNP